MVWNKPKKAIKDILFYISIIFGIISILSITVLILWFYFPQTIKKFDKNIPNFYANKIDSIYNKAMHEKNPDTKLLYFTQLHKLTKNLTQLEHYHNYKKKANEYLITYYLRNQNPTKALEIAKYWVKNDPNNFHAKFAYIHVLETTNKKLLTSYYKDLYKNYGNIYTVANKYLRYLVTSNNITEALEIEKDFTKFSKNGKVSFMLYYIDGNQTKFNDKQVIRLKEHTKEMIKHKNYSLELEKYFTDLSTLRLDLDPTFNGVKISDINISIEKDNIVYKGLDFIPMHSISQKIDNHFFITGKDAHGQIVLPDVLKNMSGKYKIKISLDIFNITSFVKNIFLNNKEWKFFYDTGKGFNEQESHLIALKHNNENYISKSNIARKKVKSIRLDFPSYIGITINDISININNKLKLDSHNISHVHGLLLKDSKLTVSMSDPYLVIKLDKEIDIHSIDVEIKF